MRMLRSAMAGMALLMGCAGMMGAGQLSSQTNQSPISGRSVDPPTPLGGHKANDLDPLAPEILERQERSRNFDRQKRLVADTDKLLELATDLKSQVGNADKADKSAAPVDAAKKAEEIEKLAKSVRDRMKG